MRNKYSDTARDDYEGCNLVGDFFISPLIKRTYGQLWNKKYPKNKLNKPRDFNLKDKKYINFIREVFCEDELSNSFLVLLRNNAQQLQDTDKFRYDNKQIISFILLWMEIQGRILTLPLNVSDIIQEQVTSILFDAGDSTIHTYENGEELRRDTGLSLLVQNNINPIQEDGTVIFGLGLGDIENGIFTVTDESGDVYDIDEQGNKLDSIQVNTKVIHNLKGNLEKYEACLHHMKTANKDTPLPKELGEIVQAIIHKYKPSKENVANVIIEKLTKKIEKYRKEIAKLNDLNFIDIAEQLGVYHLPSSPYTH